MTGVVGVRNVAMRRGVRSSGGVAVGERLAADNPSTEAVRSVGGCGAISPDGAQVCIMDQGHGPHGWEPASEPAWWGSDCTACGNTTVNTMTCSECGTSDNTIRLWFYDDDVLETTKGL